MNRNSAPYDKAAHLTVMLYCRDTTSDTAAGTQYDRSADDHHWRRNSSELCVVRVVIANDNCYKRLSTQQVYVIVCLSVCYADVVHHAHGPRYLTTRLSPSLLSSLISGLIAAFIAVRSVPPGRLHTAKWRCRVVRQEPTTTATHTTTHSGGGIVR